MAFKQDREAGSKLDNSSTFKNFLGDSSLNPKYKKFSVKLAPGQLDELEERGIKHYTIGKSGKMMSGDNYNKIEFNVPKKDFKLNKDYKLLRREGRFQKAANTIGIIGSTALTAAGIDALINDK